MKMKFLCLAVTFMMCAVFTACTSADIIIRTDLEGARITETSQTTEKTPDKDTNGKYTLIINKSSGTFHVSGECYHASVMKDENKIIVKYDEISDAIADGYKPCGSCAKIYITEDKNG